VINRFLEHEASKFILGVTNGGAQRVLCGI
jgi:hypothetical protein